MHPFRWFPGEGQRHATTQLRAFGRWVAARELETLCGSTVIVAEPTKYAWLWPTCSTCDARAHELVGTSGPP